MGFKIKRKVGFFGAIVLIALSGLNYGCTSANVLATGGGTAMVVAEGDRSLGAIVDDATIKVNIAAKFLSAGSDLFIEIFMD